jgi:hypothetical protein
MPNRPSPITYEVFVDWDGTDWAAAPDFSEAIDDISDDVAYIDMARGKDSEEGNAPAATLQIKMKAGLCAKYSPFNAGSVLWDAGVGATRIRPWLIVRIIATHLTIPYARFFGFISSIKIDPRPDRQQVTLYVTDGTDLLARQLIGQDYDDKTEMSDGEALERILNAAGWSATRRTLDTSGGADLLRYPETFSY